MNWAYQTLRVARRDAAKNGWVAPSITAEALLGLMRLSENCVACGKPLDWNTQDKGVFPSLHHNHDTGEVLGYTHNICNRLEGSLRKYVGVENLPTFLRNMFPEIFLKEGQ